MKKGRILGLVLLLCIFSSCQFKRLNGIKDNEDVIISVNKKVGSLTFLEKTNLHKITDWDLKRDVSGAALLRNGKEIAVYHQADSNVDIYQIATGRKIDSWNVGEGISNIISLKDHKTIAITNDKTNIVTFVKNNGKIIKKVKVGKNPISMIEDDHNNRLYVSSFNEKEIVGINLTNYSIDQTIKVPLTSMGLILNQDDTLLYVGGHGNGENENEFVKIYSTQTGKYIKSLHTPLMPISFFQNMDGIFTIAHGANLIYKLNPHEIEQKDYTEIGSNPYSATGTNHQAYAASYDLNKIYRINTTTMKVEKEASVGRGPFQLILREGIRHE